MMCSTLPGPLTDSARTALESKHQSAFIERLPTGWKADFGLRLVDLVPPIVPPIVTPRIPTGCHPRDVIH